MHFSERIEVPVAASEVWSFVWQVDRTAACLPGCVGVSELEPDRRYTARIEDHIGPYKVAFDMDVVIEEVEPPARIRFSAKGVDKRLGASQRASVTVELHKAGPAQTAIDIDADVEVLGKIATLGQFAIKRKAGEIVKQFARNLDAALRPTAQVTGLHPNPSPKIGGGA